MPRKRSPLSIFIVIAVLVVAAAGIYHVTKSQNSEPQILDVNSLTGGTFADATVEDTAEIAMTPVLEADSAEIAANNSTTENSEIEHTVDDQMYKRSLPAGQRINIAITGLDSRINTTSNHADANHVLSIMPDSGLIEIISVPRDTRAKAGFHDTSALNKLTNVRANRGRSTYLGELAKIARVGRIDYWVEFGFSQAMGLIELLGYDDAKSTLQVLRSRKGLGGDDYQRCYNQGQFIRQMILKHFDRMTTVWGDLAIRGGLLLVESSLTFDVCNDIITRMETAGFPKTPAAINVKVRPTLRLNFKVYDFTNESTFSGLKSKIERFNKYMSKSDSSYRLSKKPNPDGRIRSAISSAKADTAKRPQAAVSKLKTIFDQRAWLQVQDKSARHQLRTDVMNILVSAYNKLGKPADAARVRNVIETEIKMFTIQKETKATSNSK